MRHESWGPDSYFLSMNKHLHNALLAVARLGPEGGKIVRFPLHSELERKGYIELSNNFAVVTGEGLDALRK